MGMLSALRHKTTGPREAALRGNDGLAASAGTQSPRVSSEALPPAAVVLTVTVFSVAKRGR